MDIFERRRLQLIKLIELRYDGVDAKFAAAIGKDASYISRCKYEAGKKGKKRISDEITQVIYEKCSIRYGSLDHTDTSFDINHDHKISLRRYKLLLWIQQEYQSDIDQFIEQNNLSPKSTQRLLEDAVFDANTARTIEAAANMPHYYLDTATAEFKDTNAPGAPTIQEAAAKYKLPITELMRKINALPATQQETLINAITEYLDVPAEIQTLMSRSITNFHITWPTTHPHLIPRSTTNHSGTQQTNE